MRFLVTIAVCVLAGLELGVVAHQRDGQRHQLARAEMLQRGARATAAASAVQGQVGAMRMSQVVCPNGAVAHWTCVARFARDDGTVLTGPEAPRVEVRFSGDDRMRLDACRLTVPGRQAAVDCTAQASLAVTAASS